MQKEKVPAEWRMRLFAELQRMKDKMDRLWERLYEEPLIAKEQEIWQGVEKLPKFEGTGRRDPRPRSGRNIKSF